MATLKDTVGWLLDFFAGGTSESVNPEKALSHAPIWYAMNRICGHVGQLPLDLHKRLDRGSEKAKGHPAYRIAKTRPNHYQTPFQFKQQLQSHALMWGNARAYIVRMGSRPVELVPMMPDRSGTFISEGEKYHVTAPSYDCRTYEYLDDYLYDPQNDGRYVVVPDADVLHIPGFGYDGISGLSLFTLARKSWGSALATNDRISKTNKKGFTGQVMLEAPLGAFRDETKAKEFLDAFRKSHSAAGEGEVAGLLRDGVKTNVLQMSNRDAQFIEQRVFDRQEAALWFMLEQMLGDDQSVSYNSLEQKNLAYLSNCLMPWLVRWEEECTAKLLSEKEKDADSHYFKFNVASLLRADFSTTAATLSTLITSMVINRNEAREKLDMNPVEGGDDFENPAITVKSSDDSDDEAPQDNANAQMEKSNGAVLHFLGVEAKRVVDGVKHANYLDWLEEFYAGWLSTLLKQHDLLGQAPIDVYDRANERKRQLIEASGKAKDAAELKGLIEAITKEWIDARS